MTGVTGGIRGDPGRFGVGTTYDQTPLGSVSRARTDDSTGAEVTNEDSINSSSELRAVGGSACHEWGVGEWGVEELRSGELRASSTRELANACPLPRGDGNDCEGEEEWLA